uniref:PIR Superfamily Protein n=1 Tax=Strongyloides venezuelensis TaxID=75913 RepID=A0A0K0FQN0_STRVS
MNEDEFIKSPINYEHDNASGDEMDKVLTNVNGTDYFNKICYFQESYFLRIKTCTDNYWLGSPTEMHLTFDI